MASDQDTARRVRAVLDPILTDRGALRDLALRSGVSVPTLRQIKDTGRINSHHVAAALHGATDGAIDPAWAVQTTSRGHSLYERDPGRSLLAAAMERGIPVSQLLTSLGLTFHDLWVFLHQPGDKHPEVKRRVAAALASIGIQVGQENGQ